MRNVQNTINLCILHAARINVRVNVHAIRNPYALALVHRMATIAHLMGLSLAVNLVASLSPAVNQSQSHAMNLAASLAASLAANQSPNLSLAANLAASLNLAANLAANQSQNQNASPMIRAIEKFKQKNVLD